MLALKVIVTRYTDRDSQPPWVEAEFKDADGQPWCFHDKEPIFLDGEVTPPAQGWLRCTLLDGVWPCAGDQILTVSTLAPDHVEAIDSGVTTFRVRAEQLVELPEP